MSKFYNFFECREEGTSNLKAEWFSSLDLNVLSLLQFCYQFCPQIVLIDIYI